VTAGDDVATEQAVAWARGMIDQAVQQFIDRGILEGAFLEAKPAWAVPSDVLIGLAREPGGDHSFWLICGENVPFDYLASSAAGSPREAAKHFALRWHLEAARMKESASPWENPGAERAAEHESAGAQLEHQAEFLYRLVDDDALWRQDWPAG
jgi:hypothetical protein